MRKFEITWKPKFRGVGVEILYASQFIVLEVRSVFFKVRLPLGIKESIQLRQHMELAERKSRLHDWKQLHLN